MVHLENEQVKGQPMNHILIVYAQGIEEYKKHFIRMLEDFLTTKKLMSLLHALH